ncbi:NUDIX domain-containing protein [Undibacterium sp. Jales W-56]|uniref:NUDIX domain-containing protein n=1 Tax=Undibacterium sp. Jales W-56 TaxID=2897325 RepID=UPI0021D11007|nr:NUDIX domain-containing protein [Undibacterium sp. Jales W-56]MCU6432716.1 NUDIX domain-containing protein [Undibacterium sp. Jales W-56]
MHPDPAALQSLRSQLQVYFGATLELIDFLATPPKVRIKGRATLSAAQIAASQHHARQLAATGKPDDTHLMVTSAALNSSCLEVEAIQFSEICSLRSEGRKPAILSANALLVCEQTQELILLRRSGTVATHPHHWHVTGGAMHPQLDRYQGELDLLKTMQREVQEETQLRIDLSDRPLLSLVKENTTGFIQCAAIGVNVNRQSLEGMQSNWEGQAVRIAFKDLAACLQTPLWVPSGKAHVLCWLALRAIKQRQGDGPFDAGQVLGQILQR